MRSFLSNFPKGSTHVPPRPSGKSLPLDAQSVSSSLSGVSEESRASEQTVLTINTERLVELTKGYSSYIEKHLADDQGSRSGRKTSLAEATSKQILNLLKKLDKDFDEYHTAVVELDLDKKEKKKKLTKEERKKYKLTKYNLEDNVGNNITTNILGRPHRQGRLGILRALNLINQKIGQELDLRTDKDSKDYILAWNKYVELSDSLRKPDFDVKKKNQFDAIIDELPDNKQLTTRQFVEHEQNINVKKDPRPGFFSSLGLAFTDFVAAFDELHHLYDDDEVSQTTERLNIASTPTPKTTVAGTSVDQERLNIDQLPQTLPVSNFRVRPAALDGDCFFRSLAMGIGKRGSQADVLKLRNDLTNFLRANREELSKHALFEPRQYETKDSVPGNVKLGPAVDMLNLLENIVSTPRRWAGASIAEQDAGNLVPILAAQSLGRKVYILKPLADDSNNYRVERFLFDSELPGIPPRDDLATIFLRQTPDHYDLLVPKKSSKNSLLTISSNQIQPTLTRFHQALTDKVVSKVKKELEGGKKQSHWMWFAFPQISGIGTSPNAKVFGIKDLDEAKMFLNDKKLERNLRDMTTAAAKAITKSGKNSSLDKVIKVFDTYIDAKKFHACMTLFSYAEKQSGSHRDGFFQNVIDRFFDGKPHEATKKILNV